MTASPTATIRLSPVGKFAYSWGEFLTWCGDHVDPAADPWVLYPFGLVGPAALPSLLGPVIYAAVPSRDACQYVGQTMDLRDRFRKHAAVPGRRESFAYVVICPLVDIAQGYLDQAESLAADILRPAEGDRHPRRR